MHELAVKLSHGELYCTNMKSIDRAVWVGTQRELRETTERHKESQAASLVFVYHFSLSLLMLVMFLVA